MNIPNTITIVRLAVVPLIILFLVRGEYLLGLWLFFAAGVSDALDGFLARRMNQCTRLGAVLDPVADKLLIVTSVFTLFWLERLPGWLVAAIVIRDVVIAAGAIAFHFVIGRVRMAPTIGSKLNTFLQVVMIYLVLADSAALVRIGGWLPYLYLLVLFTTVASGLQYVIVWSRKALRRDPT
jgi:cardiolipin synthase